MTQDNKRSSKMTQDKTNAAAINIGEARRMTLAKLTAMRNAAWTRVNDDERTLKAAQKIWIDLPSGKSRENAGKTACAAKAILDASIAAANALDCALKAENDHDKADAEFCVLQRAN